MPQRQLELSVVMPAFNEAAGLEAAVREWHDELMSRLSRFELLVVDDCSTDETPRVLTRLADELAALRVLRTPRNSGHGKALRYGFEHCSGDFIFQTDSDRQHAPSDFWSLWEVRHGYDFLFGYRDGRADGAFRATISRTLRMVIAVFCGRLLRDANCPYKLMRRTALVNVLHYIPVGAFIPMVMVSILARVQRYQCLDLPVRHMARTSGHTSLSGVGRWLRVGLLCGWQLMVWRFSGAFGVQQLPPAGGSTSTTANSTKAKPK